MQIRLTRTDQLTRTDRPVMHSGRCVADISTGSDSLALPADRTGLFSRVELLGPCRLRRGSALIGGVMIMATATMMASTTTLILLAPARMAAAEDAVESGSDDKPDIRNRKQRQSPFEPKKMRTLMMAAIDDTPNNIRHITPPSQRIIFGQLLDAKGKPVAAAQVMLASSFNGNPTYRVNMDVTDEQGRFRLQGADDKNRLFIAAGKMFWAVILNPGQTDVSVTLPRLKQVMLRAGPDLTIAGERLWIAARGTAGENAFPFIKQSVSYTDAIQGRINLPIGRYRVSGQKQTAGPYGKEDLWVDMADFEVGDKQKKFVLLGERRGHMVTGKVDPPKDTNVIVSIAETQLRGDHDPRAFDATVCDKDGNFRLGPVPNGSYLVRITHKVIAAKAPAGGAGFPIQVQQLTYKHRIVVKDKPTTVGQPRRGKETTQQAVWRILDSERANIGQSWSWTDWQVALIQRQADRAGVEAELLRLIKQHDTPYRWRYAIRDALSKIRPVSPATTEALKELIGDPRYVEWRAELIRTAGATGDASAVGEIIKHVDDPSWRVRFAVAFTLGQIGAPLGSPTDPPTEVIVDTVASLLDDSHGTVRQYAARTLAELKSPRAATALKASLDDPFEPATAHKAWALWACSGEAQLAVEKMILLLKSDNPAGRAEAALLLSFFDHRAARALPALRVIADSDPPKRSGNRDDYELRRAKSLAASAIKSIEAAQALAVDKSHTSLAAVGGEKAVAERARKLRVRGAAKQGISVGLAISGDKRKLKQGERVKFTMFVRNDNKEPIRLKMQVRFHASYPSVTDANNKRVPTESVSVHGLPKDYDPEIEPGGILAVGPLSFGIGDNPAPTQQFWYPFAKTMSPGNYKFAHSQLLTVVSIGEQSRNERISVKSGSVEFTVTNGGDDTP